MFRSINRCFPWLFVLVLRVSSTRTRKYGIEYEYHFIEYEYEYDESQNSATSELARRVELLGTIALHWKTPLLAHGRSIVPNRSEPEATVASKTNSRKTVRRRR